MIICQQIMGLLYNFFVSLLLLKSSGYQKPEAFSFFHLNTLIYQLQNLPDHFLQPCSCWTAEIRSAGNACSFLIRTLIYNLYLENFLSIANPTCLSLNLPRKGTRNLLRQSFQSTRFWAHVHRDIT